MALKYILLSSIVFLVNSNVIADDDEARIHPDLPSSPTARAAGLEANSEYWHNTAQAALAEKVARQLNLNKAKNVIMFIGDGMSLHTVAATRSLIGDDSAQVSFEKFPYVGLAKTYCVDRQVADSACTATAYLSGVKGNYGTIGVNAKVYRRDCETALDKSTFTESIAKWAQDAAKDTGLVTTSRVTHASPAGVYAHTANRDWENDIKVRDNGCDSDANIDIAQQLVDWEVGKNLKVILGGGRGEFLDTSMKDEEDIAGWRGDGKNLISQWLRNHESLGNASYVWNRESLFALNLTKTDYLLGLFNNGHCSYHGDLKRNSREAIEPSLTEMTEIAIKMLRKNSNGYFLFVEGARIDMAHHDSLARKALEDTEELSRAVQRARYLTSEHDTLIVVTSDHGHTFTINGYPNRGADILGLTGNEGSDNLPYTVVSYANGPGFAETYLEGGGGRRDLSNDDFTDAEHIYPATVPLDAETHGGDDVGVFASGPFSHLFVGTYEQNNIPLLMAYASEIGPYSDGAAGLTYALSLVFSSLYLILQYVI